MFEDLLSIVRKLIKPKIPTSTMVEDAIHIFKSNPRKYFKGFGQNENNEIYKWPEKLGSHLDNIYIRVENFSIGYIHSISVSSDAKTVCIGHFAIDSQIPPAKGVGKSIAKAFAFELRKYGVTKIIFKENHSDFENKNYVAFFESLGAIEDKNYSSRRVWQWDISNMSIVDLI